MSADLERKENCMYKNLSTEKDCVCVHVLAHVRLSVRGILQARMLEWAVISSSRGSSLSRDQTCISCDCCIDRQIIPEPLEKPSINKTQSITPEHRSQARVANLLFCCLQIWFLNLTHLLFV